MKKAIESMKLVLMSFLILTAFVIMAQAKTVGEYNERLQYVHPEGGQVLDSTGTVYYEVDDFWWKVSTNTTDSAQNKTAINVRPSTATQIPVYTKVGSTITVGFNSERQPIYTLAGTSITVGFNNTVQPVYTPAGSTATVGFSGVQQPVYTLPGSSLTVGANGNLAVNTVPGSSVTVGFNNTKQPIYNTAGSTITVGFEGVVQPIYTPAGSSVTVGFNSTQQPIYTLPGSSLTVGFSEIRQPIYALPGSTVTTGFNRDPQPVYVDDIVEWIYVSSSMIIYPLQYNHVTLNAAATSLHALVLAGTATIVTSWDSAIYADSGYQTDQCFAVSSSSPATVTVGLGPNTTAYITLGAKRKLK